MSGHGHLMVLISCVYDPAFYYTPEEIMATKGKHVDVQSIVEKPQLYILGRSASSLESQLVYVPCRKESLPEVATPMKTSTGVEIQDTVRFFHGDGPAQQFEAGNKIGGNYPCTGCGAVITSMDDFAYCTRQNRRTLEEIQEFVLKGQAWKKGGINPLDKLCVNDLRNELRLCGKQTKGIKKPS